MRMEKDSLGEKQVPDDAYYGAHTARSLENFDVAGERMPIEIVYGIVKLKWACARANEQLELLDAPRARAISDACRKILAGGMEDQFPLDVFQSGSGTSTNMNVNEVIANLAAEAMGGARGDRSKVHPNDHVNMGQSTNNVIPSAIKIAGVDLSAKLVCGLRSLIAEFKNKALEFKDVFKSGRTHLADAVPIRLGQEFAAYACALEKDIRRIEAARQKLFKLGIGGNAIGTGLNTKKDFRPVIVRELGLLTSTTYEGAENGIEITQFLTDIAEMAGALKLAAMDVHKICNDLRLLASGPNTGFAEIVLPAVEPGSSIMPGKVNPSICEAANMACLQVMGNEQVIALACSMGQLELNTHMPLIGLHLVKAMKVLDRAVVMLAKKCVAGIRADRDACRRYFERSAGLATVLNPRLGYDRVAELVKESRETGKTLRELVLGKKILTDAEFENILQHSTEPNL
mgnify:CR=1 FL=1